MCNFLKGKKLLILGGAFQHCKLVEAAHELGVEVIVTDYLPIEQAPAKQLADKYYMHNITDIDDIVEMCINEKVDGVISTSLDACQIPYQKICDRLGLPCFGTKEQFEILTNKKLFKEYCIKNGLDVIQEYNVNCFANKDVCEKIVDFPVFIKPCDSRGSRGQSICYSFAEAVKAIEFAKKESITNTVVIEHYMGQDNDFSITALVINGIVYPFRTVDRFLGKYEDGLDKLAVGAVMPSKYTKLYLEKIHKNFKNLVKSIGIVNGPVFMQGFVDGATIRFYDPGLRLPGGEYERMFNFITGKNIFHPLIEYALTGNVTENRLGLKDKDIFLKGKYAVQILPALRGGRIANIRGLSLLEKHPQIVSAFRKYNVGDFVQETHNVSQRFCEIDVVCNSGKEIKEITNYIYNTLEVFDDFGDNMIISKMDLDIFSIY